VTWDPQAALTIFLYTADRRFQFASLTCLGQPRRLPSRGGQDPCCSACSAGGSWIPARTPEIVRRNVDAQVRATCFPSAKTLPLTGGRQRDENWAQSLYR